MLAAFLVIQNFLLCIGGEGPDAVVKAACLESRRSWVRTPPWPSSFKENKMFLLSSLVKIQYCGEPPWQRSSVLGFRPSVLEFQILCLEGSVPHSSHHPQEVVLVLFSLYVNKGGLKPYFVSFHFAVCSADHGTMEAYYHRIVVIWYPHHVMCF